MATPLTDSINALTRYANETTGASDTTLSDAVETLIAGFGKGESGGALWKSVTLEEDYITADVGCIPHWVERLNIDELADLDEYIYLYDFTGNTVEYLYGNILIVRQDSENNRLIINIRGNYSSVSTSIASNRAFYATAGTIINVYRLKADEVKPDFIRLARSFEALFYNQKNLPQKIVLNPEELDTNRTNKDVFNGAYEKGQNTATLDVTLILNQTTTFSLTRFFWLANGVKKVTITGNLNLCKEYTNMLQSMNGVEEINAVFDFSSCPYPSNSVGVLNSSNGGNRVLQEMRFAPNTARVRIAITGFEALSDESLISVANCLVEGIEQSLALHSSRTARCSLIMGNNDNGTFVADENGSMTLADFITNVKGWTLS